MGPVTAVDEEKLGSRSITLCVLEPKNGFSSKIDSAATIGESPAGLRRGGGEGQARRGRGISVTKLAGFGIGSRTGSATVVLSVSCSFPASPAVFSAAGKPSFGSHIFM